MELGAERKVVLAAPTTLISLLKAVSYGWKQETVAANASHVAELGRELHKRVADLAGHVVRLGKSLQSSVDAYNSFVGSLESRVLPRRAASRSWRPPAARPCPSWRWRRGGAAGAGARAGAPAGGRGGPRDEGAVPRPCRSARPATSSSRLESTRRGP